LDICIEVKKDVLDAKCYEAIKELERDAESDANEDYEPEYKPKATGCDQSGDVTFAESV
jgi:hypothetical protein